MSAPQIDKMDVSFDELLTAETQDTSSDIKMSNNSSSINTNDNNNNTNNNNNNTSINIKPSACCSNSENIDYFGDFNTQPTINNDVSNNNNIINSYDLALSEYISNQKPFYKSPYSQSYRKRNRRISSMTMEERDEWEQMAKLNKRRRLNNNFSNNLNSQLIIDNINENINDNIDDDYEEYSTESSSPSFEAILFENNNNNNIINNINNISSDDDDELINKNAKKK
eukprot:378914_1